MCLDLVGPFRLSWRSLLASALVCGSAGAVEPVPAPAPGGAVAPAGSTAAPAGAQAPAPSAAPLVVRVESASPVLGEADFLAALFRTLRRPLVSAGGAAPSGDAELSIRYNAAQRELVVTCYDKSR